MCGINGIVSKISDKEKLIKKMNDRIIHRGPNAEGKFVSGNVALGQRRLSIIDIGGGNQPGATALTRISGPKATAKSFVKI